MTTGLITDINLRHSETFSKPASADEENSVGLVKLPPLPRPVDSPTAMIQRAEFSESTL
ncbi:hypothetical protein TRAPUB_6889, partial [Trametes pubescens]